MNVMTYNLPVDNVSAMDRTAQKLMSAQRNGVDLPVEVQDWLDYSNNVLLMVANSYDSN